MSNSKINKRNQYLDRAAELIVLLGELLRLRLEIADLNR